MVPVEEDATFTLRHISMQLPDIDAGVNGVNDSDSLAVFRLELEDDSEFVRLRSEQVGAGTLHAKSPAPTVQIELLEVAEFIVLERSGAFPADRHRMRDGEAAGAELLLRPEPFQIGHEDFHHVGITEQLSNRTPPQKVSCERLAGGAKAGRKQSLLSVLTHPDDEGRAIFQFLLKEHVSSCQLSGFNPSVELNQKCELR